MEYRDIFMHCPLLCEGERTFVEMVPMCMQIREENAKRQHDNAAAQLRTCTDHRCTMDALLNPDGVPSDFLAAADNSEAASLAQQPWYRILYVAQVGPLASLQPCGATARHSAHCLVA